MSDLRRLPDEVRARLEARYGPAVLERRYRGFDIDYRGHVLEHRANRGLEVRQDGDEGSAAVPVIVGYATTYDQPYPMFGGPERGGWNETVAGGASAKSLKEQDDVVSLFDHAGIPLGRTSKDTLVLSEDKLGLWTETTINPNVREAMDIAETVARGDIDAMSFAFKVTREEWDDDFTERTISEVQLFDVSVVTFPANPHTIAGMKGDDLEPRSAGRSLRLARAQLDQLVH